MKRQKVRIEPPQSLLLTCHLVDENLYYMGIDKNKVDPSRLSQFHEGEENPEAETSPSQPQYLFKSGDTLLAMAKKNNVIHLPITISLS